MRKTIYLGFLYGIVVLATIFLWDYLSYGQEPQALPVLAKAKIENKEQIEQLKQCMEENKREREEKAKSEEAELDMEQKKDKKEKSVDKPTDKSESERKVLERIVEAEASNQGMKGKILVANVVLNRVKTSKDSIREVVFAHSNGCYQFSPVSDGRFYRVHVSKSTKQAVAKALNGTDYSKGARYFMNRTTANPKNVSWFDRKLTFLFRHGSHEFFR